VLQRLVLSTLLLNCGGGIGAAESVAVSPTRLSVGGDELRYVRGAVVGNVLVWAVGSALCGVVVVGVAAVRRRPLRFVAGSLRLPGAFVVVFVPLLQPTVLCAVQLLRLGSDPLSVAIGVVGAVVVAAVAAWFSWVVTVGFAGAALRNDERPGATDLPLTRLVDWLLSPFFAWHDMPTGCRFTKDYGFLFRSFTHRCHWYVVVEFFAASVGGVIGGTVPGGSGTGGCEPQRVALVVLASSELLALLLLVPMNTRLRAGCATANASVLLLSASFVLANSSAAGTVTLAGVVVVAVSSVLELLASLWHIQETQKTVRLSWSAVDRNAGAPLRSTVAMKHERLALLIQIICRSRRCVQWSFSRQRHDYARCGPERRRIVPENLTAE
jgi:hypothetical protein